LTKRAKGDAFLLTEVATSYSLVGKVLENDVYNQFGLLLLSEGTVLTDSEISLLLSHRILSVCVREPMEKSEFAERPTTATHESLQLDELIGAYGETGEQYLRAVEQTKELFSKITEVYIPPLQQFTNAFFPLLNNVLKKTGFLHLLNLIEGSENYTYRHSINVGMLSSLIAKLLNRPEKEVILLGQAGLLHDVGKMLIPQEILLKPGKLTDEEFEIMKQHTTLGANTLRLMDDIDDVIVQCALLHHERVDGSGYPQGRKGADIPLEAQILSVADIFDAVSSDRVYKTRTSSFEAAQILWKLACDGKLNVQIVTPFINYIALLYVGTYAILNNGEQVEVVLIHKDEPMRPLVRHGDRYIDLRKHRELSIVKMISG
jgi:putative nucleotidyltransferase with HDIG domain